MVVIMDKFPTLRKIIRIYTYAFLVSVIVIVIGILFLIPSNQMNADLGLIALLGGVLALSMASRMIFRTRHILKSLERQIELNNNPNG